MNDVTVSCEVDMYPYLFLGDVHEDGLELVEAVVDSLASSLLHQRLVRLKTHTAILT